MQPLNNLTRKDISFNWTNECQKSFDILKQLLINSPILQYPNLSADNKFILKTDASGFAIGAVLSNADDRVVAYASRSLNKAEKNYCTIEKELLAIVWAVKHFRPYLFGKKFQILTDHKPLIYLFTMTNPSSRLTKFRLILEEYDFEINYVRGRDNVCADALSRITIDELKELTNKTCYAITRSKAKSMHDSNQISLPTEERTDHPGFVEVLNRPRHSVELQSTNQTYFNLLQRNKIKQVNVDYKTKYIIYDEKARTIYANQCSLSPTNLVAYVKDLCDLCKKYDISEIIIIKNEKTCQIIKELLNMRKTLNEANINISILRGVETIYDKETRQVILNDFHMLPTGGHTGIKRMSNNIKKYYFWPSLMLDVERFVKRCDDCQRYKHSKPHREPMVITDTATTAFEKVFLDLVGPLNTDIDENKYILTIQCDLTKYVEGYPIRGKDAETVAKTYVENFILRYGIPKIVVTDQGTEFMSTTFQSVCKLLGVKQMNSTAYHHQTLGAIENTHKHLGAYLRIQVNKYMNAWSTHVPYWIFSFNNTVHSETKFTPYELVFGKTVVLPSNLLNGIEPMYNFDNYAFELKYRLQSACAEARSNLLISKYNRKETYDKKSKEFNYSKEDKILLRNETGNKLEPLYKGPYKIIQIKEPNVIIQIDNKFVEVHKNRVKKYNE